MSKIPHSAQVPRWDDKGENMEEETNKREQYKVSGDEVIKKVKEIVKEGNARRIIIQNEEGNTIMEFPVTAGVVGVLLAPMLAAVGALAAILTRCTIIVEKR